MTIVYVYQAAGTLCVLVTLVFGPSNVPVHVVRFAAFAVQLAIGTSVETCFDNAMWMHHEKLVVG